MLKNRLNLEVSGQVFQHRSSSSVRAAYKKTLSNQGSSGRKNNATSRNTPVVQSGSLCILRPRLLNQSYEEQNLRPSKHLVTPKYDKINQYKKGSSLNFVEALNLILEKSPRDINQGKSHTNPRKLSKQRSHSIKTTKELDESPRKVNHDLSKSSRPRRLLNSLSVQPGSNKSINISRESSKIEKSFKDQSRKNSGSQRRSESSLSTEDRRRVPAASTKYSAKLILGAHNSRQNKYSLADRGRYLKGFGEIAAHKFHPNKMPIQVNNLTDSAKESASLTFQTGSSFLLGISTEELRFKHPKNEVLRIESRLTNETPSFGRRSPIKSNLLS